MRQSGKDRAFAGLIKAYAACMGLSLRSAQRHAVSDHPDWTRYVQGQAVQAVQPQARPAPQQVAAIASLSPLRPPAEIEVEVEPEMSEPARVLKNTHTMWAEHFSEWKKALAQGDAQLALSHAAACVKLRESYDKALQKFSQWEIEQRRLIPVNEFAAMRSEFVIPLGNLLTNMPAELAVAVNPSDPAFALNRITAYLQDRLQPAIHRLITGLEGYVPAPQQAA